MMTTNNYTIPDDAIINYLRSLVGKFYKILPIQESEETGLNNYLASLEREIIGFADLFAELNNDKALIALISTLHYFVNNQYDKKTLRSDVFKSINICKALCKKYEEGGYANSK